MKKIFYTMAVAAALFAGYSAYNEQNKSEFTDIALANVEALANDTEIQSGAACYSNSIYDIDYPKVVKCGTPSCVYSTERLPIFPQISYCP